MIKNLLKSNLSKDQKTHKKRIKSYSRQAYNVKSNVIRFLPNTFEKSAIKIANHLMSHQSAIVDFSNMDSINHQRLLDFISGAVYCLGGSIDKLKDKVYLITPSSVNVKDNTATHEISAEQRRKIEAAKNNDSLEFKEETIEESF